MKQYLPVLFALSLTLNLLSTTALADPQSDLIGTDNCPFAATTGGSGVTDCANLPCDQYYFYCNGNNPATGILAGSIAGQQAANTDMANAGITNPPSSSSSPVGQSLPPGSSSLSAPAPIGWGNGPASSAAEPLSAPPPPASKGISAAPNGQQAIPRVKFQ